jgi:hypothetical protein
MKSDKIYRAVLSPNGQDESSIFDLAQCFLDGYDPEKLRAMLRSEDSGIISDGLLPVCRYRAERRRTPGR